MPVFADPKQIVIAHPIAGLGPEPAQLGPISLELALWLKYRLDEYIAHHTYNNLEVEQHTQFFRNPDIQEWNVRCILAGLRGYKAKLCSENGRLVDHGLTMAKLATEIIDRVVNDLNYSDGSGQSAKDFLNWRTWSSADELFITANFSVRQARMLKLMAEAITQAEQTNKTHLIYDWSKISTNDEIAGNGLKPPPTDGMEKTDGSGNNTESAQLTTFSTVSELTDILSYKTHNVENQPFEAVTYMTELGRRGFVPTAIFGQKARNDMRALTKYGLIDTKAYTHGQRGRPKHVVRPSVIGDRLVTDLTKRGII